MKNDIALLPIDNRPVSYLLPKQIADFSGINLLLPDRDKLAYLKNSSDINYLTTWLKDLKNIDALVIALDNWVYGGLVQSRTHDFTKEYLKKRSENFKEIISFPIYGFSSIMRIPNYNNDEEEKSYFKNYGEKIFLWSTLTYRVGRNILLQNETQEELIDKWYKASKEIPPEIIADFKFLREKNFIVNKSWLELLHEKLFNYLIFSCDDSGKYGLNVIEAEYLKNEIKNHRFENLAKVISGTDEIPLLLMTKSVMDKHKVKPSVSLFFSNDFGKNILAKYESNSIFTSCINQIETLGLSICDESESDIAICVHVPPVMQGDHVFGLKPDDTKKDINNLINHIHKINKKIILVDVAYANGADPNLIEEILKHNFNFKNLYGYAAWNTCSNSFGTALSMGVSRWISEKKHTVNYDSFKKCLLTRFLDDYAYQAKIRHRNICEDEVNKKMKSYIEVFSNLLEISGINVSCKLPWNRSFEVEILFNDV